MKKTQAKDAIRNITKQIVSYLSIVVIAMLAVLAYLGINYAAKAIDVNGNSFYAASNFRDIQIVSTKLLTPDDMNAISSVQGVSDVEGVLRTDGKIFTQNSTTNVMVVSLTERINTVQMIEGRLPQSAGECVIEKSIDDDTGLAVGDTITVLNAKGETPDYLNASDYVITGIVFHPDHSCWPLMTPGARYVLVLPEAFDKDALDNCFMTAEILVEGTEGLDRFGDKYLKRVSEVEEGLKAIAGERENIRTDDILSSYQSGIDEGQAELDDAAAELDDSRKELDENWNSYNDGVKDLENAGQQLTDSEKKLAEAQAELQDAKKKLDEAEKQLDEGKAELDKYKAELDSAKEQLDDAWKELESGRELLESSYRKAGVVGDTISSNLYEAVTVVLGPDIADMIDWGAADYDIDIDDENASAVIFPVTQSITFNFNRSLNSNIRTVIASLGVSEDELKEAYESTTEKTLEVPEGSTVIRTVTDAVEDAYTDLDSNYEYYVEGANEWDDSHDEYIEGLSEYYDSEEQYDEGLEQYNEKLSLFEEKQSSYNEGLAEYEKGLEEYEKNRKAYEDGRKEYSDNAKKLDDSLIELQDGEEEYTKGQADYDEGLKDLQGAVSERDKLDACRWVILDARGSAGYLYVDNGRRNVSNLGGTFALVFILVGALVIYATVGRIIDEQRNLVGTSKALGFFNREILAKYMIFGVSGTMLGVILGTAGSYFAIQRMVLSIYGRYYVFGAGKAAIDVPLTVIVFAGALLLSGFTVWFACTTLMKSSAISLLQLSVPGINRKSRKIKRGQKSGKGSLYGRMILLNMLNDKRRVAVTIVSIAGCCSLLVAGLTMNFGVKKTIDEQFQKIEIYDVKITYDPAVSESAGTEIEEILKANGVSYINISDSMTAFDSDGNLSSCELLCGDIESLNAYFVRLDPRSYSKITEPGDGIWIHLKMAEKTGIKAGDQLTVYDSAMNPYPAKLSGTYENRVGLYAVMDREVYTALYGREPENNAFLVLLNGADSSAISSEVSSVKGFMEFSDTEARYNEVKTLAAVLDYLSFLFIGIAGMMAYFILLNLVNMYINQKKRELTIMRINGFTVKETKKYVSLELIVCTVLGIITGLVLGSVLGYRIITLLEGTDLHIIKSVQLEAWGLAALITVVFSALISAWALRKVKYLKLYDMN